ncbi:MAG: hypothetical protein ACYSX0_10720 [Planctomycetota bacterium]|jgi:hypothetical protein
MRKTWIWAILFFGSSLVFSGCSGGTKDEGSLGGFRLIEFQISGLNNIPRNESLLFRFSGPVAPNQDLPERLKIQNVQFGQGQSDFARAIGVYLVVADEVIFGPRLPQVPDRGDAGFRANGNYHVFLKAGPDALISTSGDRLTRPQEFLFDTSEFFDDPNPNDPPRALKFLARDTTTNGTIDLSRLDPRPNELAQLDSKALLEDDRIIEPGAGGPPHYATPWQYELTISEPLDPATVTIDLIELFQVRENALISEDPADNEDHLGDPVLWKVPLSVEMVQKLDAQGDLVIFIQVTSLQALSDNARYRLTFRGDILGIDFRKQFKGDNGLTGDGQTIVEGAAFDEPGGIGYVTEFLVYDRPPIQSSRTVLYDPLMDGIEPETGQTTVDENLLNSAIYNPVSAPGTALGSLDFGDGADGSLSVSGGQTLTVDTGDTPNPFLGNPFSVPTIDPNNVYNPKAIPKPVDVTYDSPEPFMLSLESLTISSSSTLKFSGVNPIVLRVQGIAQISGILDVSGNPGQDSTSTVSKGGKGGPGGFDGGESRKGICTNSLGGQTACRAFQIYLDTSGAAAKTTGPHADHGEGPGHGLRGAEAMNYGYNDLVGGATGTGGGGASHATVGEKGEDRGNESGTPGSAGPVCAKYPATSNGWFYLESVIGVRSIPGPVYGDREIVDVTLGGSGGGGGGSLHGFGCTRGRDIPGGGGGGGGGSITLMAGGSIFATGGRIDGSGGQGGKGRLAKAWTSNYRSSTGGGGGGSGGSVALISGNRIDLSGGVVDATGGAGGLRSVSGTAIQSDRANAGGTGGKGFLVLMDADGIIDGHVPAIAGEYDDHDEGVLTIRTIDPLRFSLGTAITELFAMPAADPTYLELVKTDVVGEVNDGQEMHVFVSSAQADAGEPLEPDISTENPYFQVAHLHFVNNSTVVDITGDMSELNPPADPNRYAFVRVRAEFEYDDIRDGVSGPFAYIDQFKVSFQFND